MHKNLGNIYVNSGLGANYPGERLLAARINLSESAFIILKYSHIFLTTKQELLILIQEKYRRITVVPVNQGIIYQTMILVE